MPSKKQRIEATATPLTTLANRVLGDPYLGHKTRMKAICDELQDAVNDAAYVLYYPYGFDEPEPEDIFWFTYAYFLAHGSRAPAAGSGYRTVWRQ